MNSIDVTGRVISANAGSEAFERRFGIAANYHDKYPVNAIQIESNSVIFTIKLV